MLSLWKHVYQFILFSKGIVDFYPRNNKELRMRGCRDFIKLLKGLTVWCQTDLDKVILANPWLCYGCKVYNVYIT